jgi:Leucine-rich repeat (LRR) protein
LATPVVIFWGWLVVQPTTEAIICPEECWCDEDKYIVNCLDSGLNSIPLNLTKHVRALVLNGNNITYFENDTFVSRGLVELQMIAADFCNISKIELGAFNGLTKLIRLSMRGNEIREIIPGTFQKNRFLEHLNLDYNNIEHFGSDVLSGLVDLKYIVLEGNRLHYLHQDTFLGLPKLERLYLSNNYGLQIPTDRNFINSHSLTNLSLSHCNVSSVSVVTFANVSALEMLSLSYNKLRSLDIDLLKLLPKLNISES